MSVAGLVVSVIVVLALLWWVFGPLLARATEPTQVDESVVDRQRERLNVYYGRVLRNLHDLDEDFALGKLDETDYKADRARWTAQGVEVLRRLDELDTAHLVAPADADVATIDAAIEQTVEQATGTPQEV